MFVFSLQKDNQHKKATGTALGQNSIVSERVQTKSVPATQEHIYNSVLAWKLENRIMGRHCVAYMCKLSMHDGGRKSRQDPELPSK